MALCCVPFYEVPDPPDLPQSQWLPARRVQLRFTPPERFQVLRPFVYLTADGRRIDMPPQHDPVYAEDGSLVPANSTDLASVPSFLWGVVASYGEQLRPALLHDVMSLAADDALAAGDRASARARRKDADDTFRVALRESGVHPFRALLFWTGVSLDRFVRFAAPAGAVMVALLGVVAALAARVGVIAAGGAAWFSPLWWLVTVAAAALVVAMLTWRAAIGPLAAIFGAPFLLLVHTADSGLRGHVVALVLASVALVVVSAVWTDLQVMLVTLVLIPVLLPAILATFAAQLLVALPDQVMWRVQPSGEPPRLRPTVLPMR